MTKQSILQEIATLTLAMTKTEEIAVPIVIPATFSCHCERYSLLLSLRGGASRRSNLSMRDHYYYIYIMTNRGNSVLYTGITNNLVKRVYEHKHKLVPGFTAKYNIDKLVYFEQTESVESAILREKQIKAGSRASKIKLIESINPEWKDLYEEIASLRSQ